MNQASRIEEPAIKATIYGLSATTIHGIRRHLKQEEQMYS